jgi:hypothetical protein
VDVACGRGPSIVPARAQRDTLDAMNGASVRRRIRSRFSSHPGGEEHAPGPARSRRIAQALLVAGVGLVAWTVYLGIALPERETAQHWDLAWIGLDVAMIAAIATAAWGVRTQHVIMIPASVAVAVLLAVDAWFDTLTASGEDAVAAYLMAVFIELPAAVFFAWIARRAMVITVARATGVPPSAVRLGDLPATLDDPGKGGPPAPPTTIG